MSLTDAARCISASQPVANQIHLFEVDGEQNLFAVNGSRLFGIDAGLSERLHSLSDLGLADEIESELSTLGLSQWMAIDDTPLSSPPVHALSLAIAQKCNLGCAYCYAQGGEFGDAPKSMLLETARQSVDFLIDQAAPGAKLNLSFLGGEPLVNRKVLQAATLYAAAKAEEHGNPITFSVTTNGTLLTEEDGEFFEEHGFAVSLSIDGPREVHNALRPFKSGAGSFDVMMARVQPLLGLQRRMQVSARVTVTPANLDLLRTLKELVELGFHSVGFSPMLSAPNGQGEMQRQHLETMLGGMIDCGKEFERRVLMKQRFPFANMVNAMREIQRGTHRPYPCGAGAGYFGVSADGDLAACHRFVGDEAGAMGSISSGINPQAQESWLRARHVHRQEPCNSCWARYLCGGGCHHEVIKRGRPACDYIRGWLHYCLEAFVRLQRALPEGAAVWPASV